MAPRAPAAMFRLYLLFAALATLANLAAQEAVLQIPGARLELSILAGTAAGFVLKYLLDKIFVFDDAYSGHGRELRKVLVYGAFSVGTTLVFWAFEIAFWTLFGTDFAKYAGAVIGLAIGYGAKFLLDRAFVFTERRT
ncbi:GtrA family protein [Aquabacter spiritensis]|uniref:Putative flippase GtrA n=1 Tax=Aquabacter spiritensis TaxID=933073 RepID=A0A4R3LU25_9HYPH|nr:GtrA family protein [Aquabacter spiritensis]TCT02155.1 putative flippase GtrA [Aquabacter spiritensis]